MIIPENYIKVLDHGYVGLVDKMGNDLSAVSAARVSYDKKTSLNDDGSLIEKDQRLLQFLLKEDHTSPFRHAALTFEIYAPLLCARQWWKYAVSSTHIDDQNGWNESSRRYITEEPIFYIPDCDKWRGKPANSKQGSSNPLDPRIGKYLSEELIAHIDESIHFYEEAMALGVCAEQARLFLPAYGMYVRWRWTISLAGVIHFLQQRLEHDAQWEIQQFARAVTKIVQENFPETYKIILSQT